MERTIMKRIYNRPIVSVVQVETMKLMQVSETAEPEVISIQPCTSTGSQW